MTVTSGTFRDALATVATSVSVAATVDERGVTRAVTIGSLCSLSLDPPLVLFALARDTGSHAVFCSAERFSVTVLTDRQRDVARRFAGPPAERAGMPLMSADRLPVVPGGLTCLWCSAHALVTIGDHTIVIGRVEDVAVGSGTPLLYHQRGFHAIADPVADATG
jgi:flavin reductase ActVB